MIPVKETPAESAVEVDAEVDDLTPEQLAAQWEEEKPPAAGALANAASSLVVLGVGIAAHHPRELAEARVTLDAGDAA